MYVLIAISALASHVACSVENWSEVRVKYGTNYTANNEQAFYKVESTLAEALAGDWTSTEVTNFLNLQAVSFEGDYAFTPLYDAKGYLAGAQIASPVDIVDSNGPPTFRPTVSGTNEILTINGTKYYASTFLFVDPDTLESGGRPCLNDGVIGNGLWVRNTSASSGFTQIPDDLDDLVIETLYTWQNCIPNMGIHYFYNMKSSYDCNQFYSWFLLAKEGSVSGIGYQIPGNPYKLLPKRSWYDLVTIPRAAAQLTVPIANDCLYDWTQTYGAISIHVYFTPSPWNITCDQNEESVSPITMLNVPQSYLSSALELIFGTDGALQMFMDNHENTTGLKS